MHNHDVETASDLASEAFLESVNVVELLLFGATEELVRNSLTVLDLERNHLDCVVATIVYSLLAALCNEVDLSGHCEDHNVCAAESDRCLAAELSDRRLALSAYEYFLNQFVRE